LEGLKVATPALADYVVPLSVIVLVGLFILQSWGSARIGAYFGPVMALWFAALAVAGLFQVVQTPGVLAALNPLYALRFLIGHGGAGFLASFWPSQAQKLSMPTWAISVESRSGSIGSASCCRL
jgi:KUP system potassium uptake protein